MTPATVLLALLAHWELEVPALRAEIEALR